MGNVTSISNIVHQLEFVFKNDVSGSGVRKAEPSVGLSLHVVSERDAISETSSLTTNSRWWTAFPKRHVHNLTAKSRTKIQTTCFTLSIPHTAIQLLQFKTTKAQNLF